MDMISNYRQRAEGNGRHLDVHRQRVTERGFFFKIKTRLLNVEFAMNSAEGMFEDWRETT